MPAKNKRLPFRKPLNQHVCEQVYKPSSVLNGHLSRRIVADALKRLPRDVTGRHLCPSINLASGGVYIADKSPGRW